MVQGGRDRPFPATEMITRFRYLLVYLIPLLCPVVGVRAATVNADVLKARVAKQLTDISTLQAEINTLSQRLGRPVSIPTATETPALEPEPLPEPPSAPPGEEPAPEPPAPAPAPPPTPPRPAPEPATPPAPPVEPEPTRDPPARVAEAIPPAPEPEPPAPPAPEPPVEVPQPPAHSPGLAVHVVQPGETLFAIARDHGTTLDALLEANDGVDPRRMRPGQEIRLPRSAAPASPPRPPVVDPPPTPQPHPPSPTTPAKIHTVAAGESLYAIARRHGVTAEAIVAANDLDNPDTLSIGQKLRIPPASSEPGSVASPPPRPTPPAASTYVVKPGDTLFGISRQTGTPVGELRKVNRLQGDTIVPGQILKVRSGAGASAATPEAAEAASPSTRATIDYEVQPGDSLFSVSRKFFLAKDELAKMNGLDSEARLQAGQTLRIPANAAKAREHSDSPTP